MEQDKKDNMPTKSCMITLAFGIESDEDALAVKKVIDEAVKDIEKKRYSFGIIEAT